MTSEYEDHHEKRKGKTLDDIYKVIRSIDRKVEDILDELSEIEFKPRYDDNGWSMRDLYDNGEVY